MIGTRIPLPANLARAGRGTVIHIPVSLLEFTDGTRTKRIAGWRCQTGSDKPVWLDEASDLPMCITCLDSHLPVIYRCYAADSELLYIGCTAHWRARRLSHERLTPWWPLVADIRFQTFRSAPEAWKAERVAIWNENPSRNKMRLPA